MRPTLTVLILAAAVRAAAPPTAADVLQNAPPAPPPAEVALPNSPPPPQATQILLDAPGLQQQHWVAINLSGGQPSTGRVQLKVWDRPQNSLWLELYGGSALFEGMYGFGARIQHTAAGGRNGDALFVSPGCGVHLIPNYTAYYGRQRTYGGSWNLFGNGGGSYTYMYTRQESLAFLAADADVSWVHDFTDHFAFELGLKLGLAFKVAGDIGEDQPAGMFGSSVYPILAVYSGFRF